MASSNSPGLASGIRNSKLFYWLPPVIWLAAIFYFSSDTFSGENTGSLFYNIFHFLIPSLTPEQFRPFHHIIRKAAHFTEYGILALLLFRAFRGSSPSHWSWRWAVYAWLIVAVYALSDELHQSFTRHRTASIYDSLIDTSGGTAALALMWLRGKFGKDQLSPRSMRND